MAARTRAAPPTTSAACAMPRPASVIHSHHMPTAAAPHSSTNGQPPKIAAAIGSGASASAETMRTVSSLRRWAPVTSCARPDGSAPATGSGSRLGDETAEPALAAMILGQRLLEHGAVEVGPVDGNEHQLAVGGLPQQEIGQTLDRKSVV